MSYRMFTWDWKEYPDFAAIGAAINQLSDGAITLHEIDTGSDQFAIVISNEDLDEEMVAAIYAKW